METNPKIVIGCPVSDVGMMSILTTQSIGGAIITSGSKVIDFVMRRSCDIVSNRTFLVKHAIEAGATHLLFVDHDMVFPHDTIDRLLAHDKEIVGVEYVKREFPIKRLCEPLEERKEDGIYKAKYTGTGLMLIDLSIFDEKVLPHLKTPWFNFGRGKEGQLVLGEDVWFCNMARDAGYDVWVDPTVKVGHIGEFIYA